MVRQEQAQRQPDRQVPLGVPREKPKLSGGDGGVRLLGGREVRLLHEDGADGGVEGEGNSGAAVYVVWTAAAVGGAKGKLTEGFGHPTANDPQQQILRVP